MNGSDKNQAGKYLTFQLGKEEYGIPITKVREIIGMMEITGLPQHADYIKGVINLRDNVIPVVDLKARFFMQSTEYTDRSCIVVAELARVGGGKLTVGLIVDGVSEVRNLKEGQIEDGLQLAGQTGANYISGMARVDGAVLILLEIDRVFAGENMEMLDEAV